MILLTATLLRVQMKCLEQFLVNMKKHGLGNTVHKDPISSEDLEKLYTFEVFSKDSDETPQQRMFFEYMYYFCNRGRENLREIQKDDFEIKNDSTGLKYVMMKKRRQTKNHRGDEFMKGKPECMKNEVNIYTLYTLFCYEEEKLMPYF